MQTSAHPYRIGGIALVLVLLAVLPALSFAQLGEEAGALNFQVQIGHTQTLQLTLANGGSTPIGFRVQTPKVSQENNQITPNITISPLYGTIAPYSTFPVNVTVFMSINNTPGAATWNIQISAVEASNASNPGGAVIQAGVLKIATIQAISSTTTTSTTTTTIAQVAAKVSVPASTLIIIAVVMVIIIVIATALLLLRKRAPPSKHKEHENR